MYSGSPARRARRSSSAAGTAPGCGTMNAARLSAPPPSRRATTTACRTAGCLARAASTSPGSMRKPRTFTCRSSRPRYSSTPSGRQRTKSPVRYMRASGGVGEWGGGGGGGDAPAHPPPPPPPPAREQGVRDGGGWAVRGAAGGQPEQPHRRQAQVGGGGGGGGGGRSAATPPPPPPHSPTPPLANGSGMNRSAVRSGRPM